MPVHLSKFSREAYCSAPPLPSSSSSIRPPRLTRESELRRPRVPLRTPEVKAEISSIESVDFEANEFDVKPDVKPDILLDPRQTEGSLRIGLAALAIRPSSLSSLVDEGPSTSQAPIRYPEAWGFRGQRLSHVPEGDLGPADPPRKRGRPKGSKLRPRVAFAILRRCRRVRRS